MESGAKRAEEKKAEERKKERGGFLPPLFLLSAPLFFFARFSLHRPTLSERLDLGDFSGASRLGCGRKKERQQSHQCLKVTRDQAFFFFWKERKIFINCYAIALHVHFPDIWLRQWDFQIRIPKIPLQACS